ncbi:MAG: Type III restriction-modification system methylation subunit [Nitrospira sp.]|nr:MAG: Type III restriction-modification system methylation subunit [Nitrospira sp.]
MTEKKPKHMVCLDAGFAGNDQLKANAVQIFKTKGSQTSKLCENGHAGNLSLSWYHHYHVLQ